MGKRRSVPREIVVPDTASQIREIKAANAQRDAEEREYLDNPVVAYRRKLGKKYTGHDKEIVGASCRSGEDREIVLRSENGQRIKAGAVSCAACGRKIVAGK